MLWQVDDLRCGVWYAMNKEQILSGIRRTAEANSGKPLGSVKFQAETGIRYSDWHGRYWVRWGDAIREAGLIPNQRSVAYHRAELLERYAALARELGRLPVDGDLRMRAIRDSEFPSHNASGRLGTKAETIEELLRYCRSHEGYDDVVRLCEEHATSELEAHETSRCKKEVEIGFVYLIKSGRFYKIGKTNAAGRREYELSIQLPEPVKTVHLIRTDDPAGIEAYWHKRFAEKRKNGEWFELDATDVAAFKRRKFM